MPTDLSGNWHSKNLGFFASNVFYVSFVPDIPDGDLFPVTCPLHLEKAQATLLEYPHAIGIDTYLGIGRLGPRLELLFRVFISYDHDIKGFSSPEIAYGHLMECDALGC